MQFEPISKTYKLSDYAANILRIASVYIEIWVPMCPSAGASVVLTESERRVESKFDRRPQPKVGFSVKFPPFQRAVIGRVLHFLNLSTIFKLMSM